MKTALIVLAGVLLRDLWCWCSGRVWLWRKRRDTQRRVQADRELRALEAQLVSAEKTIKAARIAKLMRDASTVPYPQLLASPLIIAPRSDLEFLQVTRQLHANFAAQRKTIFNIDFEKN
jgi:hypothetical protein